MAIYSTEITSDKHLSDGPLHQRLLKAYHVAMPYVKGDLLELGCGEGRGIELLSPLVSSYTAVDKISEIEEGIRKKHSEIRFINMNIPPFQGIQDNSFDTVVSFQVIEHIEKDSEFLQEIKRVLRPGGKAILSTPNIKLSLTRNPWHIREYSADEFTKLCSKYFTEVEAKGITGNEKVWEYYEMNKKSVSKYKKLDIFNLEKRLPANILKIPYDFLNRINRNQLHTSNQDLVVDIAQEDYFVSDDAENAFDLFYILHK